MPASDFVMGLRAKIGNDLLQVPTVSILIFDEDDRVLLVRHVEGNVWSTVGGMIEPLETPTDAAIREAFEETGLEVQLDRIVGVFGGEEYLTVYSNGDRMSWVSTVFEASIKGGDLRPDQEETLELRYFSLDELQDVDCVRHVVPFVEVALRRDREAYIQPPRQGTDAD